MIHTFATMGTVASLRLHGDTPSPIVERIEAVFADADERFSLYRPDSEASRIARHDIALSDASTTMRDMYALALDWRAVTSGVFTPHRSDGFIDLAGVVKAAAIDAAGTILDETGIEDWLLNAGGDILSRGSDHGAPWRVGIVDPVDRDRLLTSVELTGDRRAIATSGIGERGEHVWRRNEFPTDADPVQVTVLAAHILTADVWATAILAGGTPALDDATDRFDLDVLCCDRTGALLVTQGLRARITDPATVQC
ncbi:FAD:protein FMN transferase [Plantibacter sp. YIM 135347]|jgi:thiamine biosynthesis lipoprotein|uniref:FAD:protein FMN transferase n=1 Tax=Plantibacter sp. YIM 135347 TaxID=3423919 RepID=UPI003D359189